MLSIWKTNKALTVLLLSNSLILVAGAMLGPIYAIFVQDLGGNLISVGSTAGLLALTSGVTAYVAGRYTDRIKKTSNIIFWGYISCAFVFLLYIPVSNIWQLYLVQAVNGLVRTFSAPAFDKLYALHLNKESSGAEYGEWEATWYITLGLGGILGGFVADAFGFKAVFVMMSVISFLAALYVKVRSRDLL